MRDLEDHPIAATLPMMSDPEFAALVASMRSPVMFDDRHPIVLYEGRILDGRNRYRAATKACVGATFVEFDKVRRGDESPWAFVKRENLDRRQIEPGQRVALELKFLRGDEGYRADREKRKLIADEQRRQSMRGKRNNPSGQAGGVAVDTPLAPLRPDTRADGSPKVRERVILAEMACVSEGTASRALQLEKRSPELFEQVARGEKKLNQALRESGLRKDQAALPPPPPPPPPPPAPARRYGPRPAVVSEEARAEVVRQYRAGGSASVIAKVLVLSSDTVKRILDEAFPGEERSKRWSHDKGATGMVDQIEGLAYAVNQLLWAHVSEGNRQALRAAVKQLNKALRGKEKGQ